jgi:hypothetical protein
MRFLLIPVLLFVLTGCVSERERFDRDMEQHYEVQCDRYYSVYASSDIEGAKKALDDVIALSLAEKNRARFYWRFDIMIAFAQARLAVIAEHQGQKDEAERLFASASDYQVRGDKALSREMQRGGSTDNVGSEKGFTPAEWRKAVREIDAHLHVKWDSLNRARGNADCALSLRTV